jgi:hypothetical protein
MGETKYTAKSTYEWDGKSGRDSEYWVILAPDGRAIASAGSALEAGAIVSLRNGYGFNIRLCL